MEEALHSRAPAAVAGLIDQLDLKTSQRLQLAAARCGLPLSAAAAGVDAGSERGGDALARRQRRTAARDRFGLIARSRWRLTLERCRNGRPGEWMVEYDHVAHRFSLAAALADPALSRSAGEQAIANHHSVAPVDPHEPFVLAVAAAGGPRIAALNEAAEAAGLALGETLADARAKAGHVQVRAVDPTADDAALRRLALWATRYTPTASPWGEENGADGFFLDIEGAAHLFGGEEMLLADLCVPAPTEFRPAGAACRRRDARRRPGRCRASTPRR